MCDLESANKQGSGSGIDKNEETPMTGPLENDVINALRRKANSVPDAAIERLSSIDYNPRTASWQRAVRVAMANFMGGVSWRRRRGP